jgi:hypothetical protein
MFKAVQFTKSNLNNDLRKDIDAVLSKYGKEAGVHFNVGNITFNELEANIKLTASLPSSSGVFITAEQKDFNMFSGLDEISVKLNELGSSRNLGTVRMIGYKARNRKYPYIVEQVSTGSRYKLSTSSARSLCPITV